MSSGPGSAAALAVSERRLSSWKEIGAYLACDARTAQRWEKTEGLPVHRHQHNTLSSVYAYASELDNWRKARRPAAPSPGRQVITEAEPDVAVPAPAIPQQPRSRRTIALIAGSLVLILAAGALWSIGRSRSA